MTGTVGPYGRPNIAVRIEGRREPLVCIVDTCFDGTILVPGGLADGPGFEPFGSEYLSLADGSIIVAGLATALTSLRALTVSIGYLAADQVPLDPAG